MTRIDYLLESFNSGCRFSIVFLVLLNSPPPCINCYTIPDFGCVPNRCLETSMWSTQFRSQFCTLYSIDPFVYVSPGWRIYTEFVLLAWTGVMSLVIRLSLWHTVLDCVFVLSWSVETDEANWHFVARGLALQLHRLVWVFLVCVWPLFASASHLCTVALIWGVFLFKLCLELYYQGPSHWAYSAKLRGKNPYTVSVHKRPAGPV